MRRPTHHRGYFSSGKIERDMLGCGHCSRSFSIEPVKGAGSRRIDRCGACARPLCLVCAAELATSRTCRTFEQRLEALERQSALRRAITE